MLQADSSSGKQVQAAQPGHVAAGRGQIFRPFGGGCWHQAVNTDNSNYLAEVSVNCCDVWCCWLSPLTGSKALSEFQCCSNCDVLTSAQAT